jgi:hypothetical protein
MAEQASEAIANPELPPREFAAYLKQAALDGFFGGFLQPEYASAFRGFVRKRHRSSARVICARELPPERAAARAGSKARVRHALLTGAACRKITRRRVVERFAEPARNTGQWSARPGKREDRSSGNLRDLSPPPIQS